MNKRTIKWWEVSQKTNQIEAMQEEFAEILDQHRWERKNYGQAYDWEAARQDWKDFWEKYSEYSEGKGGGDENK